MTSPSCCTCFKPKANYSCGICGDSLCKKCTQFVDEGRFSFYKTLKPELTHTTYCLTCYEQKVIPEMERYDGMMEAAKNMMVFAKAQAKETHRIKRLEDPVKVKDCADYDEAVLRLAFLGAQRKFNAIIDMDIVAKKIVTGTRQTTVYSGSAIPADVKEEKLIKDRSNWSSPN